MILVDLTDEERTARGLGKDKLGLFVKGLGQYGKHAAAKNAGFQKDDVLIELNGQSARLTEGEMIGQLLQNTKPGDKMKAAVLRGDKRVELILPMQ
jgi:S1-C subfamily serine protease